MNARHFSPLLPESPARMGRLVETVRMFRDPIAFMEKRFTANGDIFLAHTMALGSPPSASYPGSVFVRGSRFAQALAQEQEHFHRAPMSLSLYPVKQVTPRTEPLTRIMTGLASFQGELHRQQRRLISPSLSREEVQSHFDETVKQTRAMFDRWRVGEVIDLSQELSRLILHISAVSLFGQGRDQQEGERIGRLIDRWVAYVMSASHLFPVDLPGLPYARWLDLSREIEETTRRIIVEKRESGANDGSLLSRLIRATDEDGAQLSEDDLVGHISLLLWGSRDAVAAALGWTFFLVSQHASVQEEVVQELDGMLGGGPPTLLRLGELTATERALKESMRILPPFPMINRVVSDTCPFGEFQITQGTEIILSIFHTHRDAEVFADPAAYQPQRWNSIDPDNYQYLPFGVGARLCPGRNFAWQTLLVVTAMVLQRFRLELADGASINRVVKLGMLPRDGLPMKVNLQDREFDRSVKPFRGNLREMVSSLPG